MPQIPEEAFRRADETPDEEFYRTPRIVTHIDDGAIAAVTQLYGELFRGHVQLVERYLEEAGNFSNVRSIDRSPRRLFSDPLYAVIGESTGPYSGGLSS